MNSKIYIVFFMFMSSGAILISQDNLRARDYGCTFGVMSTGKYNAITDVPGVSVGQATVIEGNDIRTGITVIIPHQENIFQSKVSAAMYIGNGFGKLMGISQVEELGNIETPIALTNTLSVPQIASALADYVLAYEGNQEVRSVNPIVGETNDGGLNAIRKKILTQKHLISAIDNAKTGLVEEGNVGAGTGTICFGFKGGIGTSSRKLPKSLGGYHVGVLVQTNFGGNLVIDGLKVGELFDQYPFKNALEKGDGSCMIVVGTDAPLDARNLKRLAKRAMLGLAKTGGIMSNGSGDYVIAFSNNKSVRVPYSTQNRLASIEVVPNDFMSPLFMAAIEATEEAIINSLFAAEDMTGNGRTIKSVPKEKLKQLLQNRK